MKIYYTFCDICDAIIKPNESCILYISNPVNKSYREIKNSVTEECKEICPACKEMLDNIFKYRLMYVKELTDECENILRITDKRKNKKDSNKK